MSGEIFRERSQHVYHSLQKTSLSEMLGGVLYRLVHAVRVHVASFEPPGANASQSPHSASDDLRWLARSFMRTFRLASAIWPGRNTVGSASWLLPANFSPSVEVYQISVVGIDSVFAITVQQRAAKIVNNVFFILFVVYLFYGCFFAELHILYIVKLDCACIIAFYLYRWTVLLRAHRAEG